MRSQKKLKTASPQKTEIAVELLKQLDGISVSDAKAALARAEELLDTMTIVSAKSL